MKHFWLVRTFGCRFSAWLLVSVMLLAIGVTHDARADVVTFAQFSQQMVSDQDFSYANNGTGASFNAVAGGIPIFLMITQGFAPGRDRMQMAHLFMTSSTTDRAIPPEPPDLFTREHITGPANTIQVVLDTPIGGKTNFLTVTFSDGLLSGRLNATEASLKTSDADSGNPFVSFTSDFIDFTNSIEHGFSLSFSSVNATDGSGNLEMADNGFFKSFLASGTGTFDTTFASPVFEPSSIVLVGFAVLALLCLACRCSILKGHLARL